jgi:hypothetical protein
VNRVFSEILGQVQDLLGRRYGGCWLSADPDGSNIALNFSAVSSTPADQAAVEAIVRSHPDFPYPMNSLVSVPYSYEDLVGFYEAIDATLERRRISGIGVGVRPDLGRVVVELPSPDSPALDELSGVVPQDAVYFTVAPTAFHATLISRNDIPPYKFGKTPNAPDAVVPPGGIASCTSGFVFTGDLGTGWEGVLMGSTAGHCYRLYQPVADGQGDIVGRADVSPITFWTGDPAKGDAALSHSGSRPPTTSSGSSSMPTPSTTSPTGRGTAASQPACSCAPRGRALATTAGTSPSHIRTRCDTCGTSTLPPVRLGRRTSTT